MVRHRTKPGGVLLAMGRADKSRDDGLGRNHRCCVYRRGRLSLFCLSLIFSSGAATAFAQSAPQAVEDGGALGAPVAAETGAPAGDQLSQQAAGQVSGTVVDATGTAISGAHVQLRRADQRSDVEVLSGTDGQFSIPSVLPGAFQLTITSDGFSPQTISGTVQPGETLALKQIVLSVATVRTEMRVEISPFEVAEAEIKAEEKQRVLGVIPNFYVSYVPDAAPLAPRQKFELAWKTMIDPVTLGFTGAVAGIEQAHNNFSGFGQGAQGYGKRFGAAYADSMTALFLGDAILPTVFKQDPRYFYKGKGSTRSRFFYAIANAFICKGDNGRWQPNYSNVLGALGSGAISNLYYPPENRDGARLTLENGLIEIGGSAALNVFQEFLLPKLTSHHPSQPSGAP